MRASAGQPLQQASSLDMAKALAAALQARALPAPEPLDVEAVPVPATATEPEVDPFAEEGEVFNFAPPPSERGQP
jgi:hypothetical protein